jgi:hypothetical protein
MAHFFSNNSAAGSKRRQKTRNSSAQFQARREGSHDEGKNCSRCGVHDPNVPSKWVGHWNCEDCGGNAVSRKVVNSGSSESAPVDARRERLARFRNKQKAPASTFVVSTFLDKPDRPKTVKKVTPKKANISTKSAKELKREAAMKALGLTEADIIKFAESN